MYRYIESLYSIPFEDQSNTVKNTNSAEQSRSDMARVNALIETANTARAKGDIRTAISSCEQLVRLDPMNAASLSNLGVLYLNSGNKERAVKMFGDAHALEPQDQNIRMNFLNALGSAAAERSTQGSYPQAIAWLRTALSLEPHHPALRSELANALEFSGQPADLADFMPGAKASQLGTHLLIACMPKSGSTFLKAALRALTGWQEAGFAYANLQNEQDIYLPNLLRVAHHNTVTQQHCRATGPNTQILQAFDIKPIVLVRKFPDIVLSLSNFYDQGAVANTFFGDIWPSLDEEEKYDLIIDQVMPWYAGFYASWERAQRLGRLNCLFITYREMVADKPAMLARISDFLDLKKTPEECAAAVRAVDGDVFKTRFNKGVVGRGDQALSAGQIARLRRLVAVYGDVDLERIGMR